MRLIDLKAFKPEPEVTVTYHRKTKPYKSSDYKYNNYSKYLDKEKRYSVGHTLDTQVIHLGWELYNTRYITSMYLWLWHNKFSLTYYKW